MQESKEFLVREKIEEIYFRLRDGVSPLKAPLAFHFGMRFPKNPSQQISQAELELVDESIKEVFDLQALNPEAQQEVTNLRSELQAILDEPENINQSIENAFNKVFASEFDDSLLLQGATEGRIQLFSNDLPLIDLVVTEQGTRLMRDVEPVVLKDATFIDSPLILNHHDLLARSQTLLDMDQRRSGRLGRPYTTLHTKDLFDKLRTPVLSIEVFEQKRADFKANFFEDIQAIIDGNIAYDRSERDFVFQRNDQAISIKNTASGIKVFGLLQILVANEFIAKNTALIFDEPENHLHPKWQLKLAEVLVKLVEKGVYVLVSSHSPYLIEALKRYIDHSSVLDKDKDGRFVLAQDQCITDSDRLSDIFSVLAEPFETFRKMDADDLGAGDLSAKGTGDE